MSFPSNSGYSSVWDLESVLELVSVWDLESVLELVLELVSVSVWELDSALELAWVTEMAL